ncbi:S66 peptidase family protein [Oceanobacillus massiliensis]|uniref:S66 peptidase family protein n=1 Tax=Oceanobacillus massiliensis TaxID=1465765 RepID=UPI00028833EE|nr:LD-carboxypeptidase [Oceanobacillus massiliensis]
MIHPARLKKGDTIGVVAPAGPPNIENLNKAIPFFEEMGLRVKLGRNIESVRGYLAGTDEERLEDFHDMIADRKVKGIFFASGGYGSARIADKINYHLIKENPKIIWGYSDITFLHTAIRQQADLITFHGPMLASDIGKNDFDKFSAHMFHQLFEPTELSYSEKIAPLEVYTQGNVQGQLVGGNLSLMISTLGTAYEIDTKDKILLLEDVGEESYRVDSMLNQLRLAGKISAAAGIVIGDFADSHSQAEPTSTLQQVFEDYFSDFHGPVMGGFKIGHCLPHFAIPLGTTGELSTIRKTLLIGPGVK